MPRTLQSKANANADGAARAGVTIEQRWGKAGHYKIAELACLRVRDAALARLLRLNLDRITFTSALNSEFARRPAPSRAGARFEFHPLADVPDLVWKRRGESARDHEGPNHFADLDEPSPGKADATLAELSRSRSFLDPIKWREFYNSLGIPPSHQGLLPFRVWQLFDLLSTALARDNVAEFIAAAGVLAHYVGDACQPLHASYLHDGDPTTGRGQGLHSTYESTMIERYAADLSAKIDANLTASHAANLANPPLAKAPLLPRITNGRSAARATLNLMRRSLESIPPQELIRVYERSKHNVAALWSVFGDRTAARLIDGAETLAAMWQSAWRIAHGAQHVGKAVRALEHSELRRFYADPRWAPSVWLGDMRLEGGVLRVVEG